MSLAIGDLRQAYLSGVMTPRDLLGQLRDRAAQLNATYCVFISLLDEAQLEPYLAALDGVDPASLPLFGVPFAMKDNIDLHGVATTAGCPAYAYQPDQSAMVVQRLLALGAIPLGKANLDQFATGLNGTRTPYGECRNAILPEFISGGSSSGSAVAVALDLVSFSLGTDTAGSGRVPAALNGLIGLKPTLGLLSARGVVPACRSLDTISIFSRRADDASLLLGLLAEHDHADPYSRPNRLWNGPSAFKMGRSFRFGVIAECDQVWLGCSEGPRLYEQAVARMVSQGGTPVEIPFSPFFDAAKLTYDGPWVAERFTAVGEFIATHPGEINPVVRGLITASESWRAHQLFAAEAHRKGLKQTCDDLLMELDFLLSPTIPRAYTRAEMNESPVVRNSDLGIYTNFVNLLDYAAVAVPAGYLANGLPWGVTLVGRAFTDQSLLAAAQRFTDSGVASGEGGLTSGDGVVVVVCGAHLEGQPLNSQLRDRGARLMRRGRTAASYRLFALPGGPPVRPALVRSIDNGAAIEVEEWRMPFDELGSFLAGIPAPLGLGKLELDDGRWEIGFICENGGIIGAEDITAFGGWRSYVASRAAAPTAPVSALST